MQSDETAYLRAENKVCGAWSNRNICAAFCHIIEGKCLRGDICQTSDLTRICWMKARCACTSLQGERAAPIQNAKITISYTGDPESQIEEVNTDDSGLSEEIALAAPPVEWSMEPGEKQPYSEYTIEVTAEGFRPVNISGIEVFSDQLAMQDVRMEEEEARENQLDNIVIPAHTLFAEYPPKIPESEIKPVTETGEIVLSRVVIPEFVIVHDGAPGTRQPEIIMCVTGTISKTWRPVRFTLHGRTPRCAPIF